MPISMPHIWIPDTSLITDPVLALTMMARTWALRSKRPSAASIGITYRGGTQNAVSNGGIPTLTLSGIAGLAENDVVVAKCRASSGVPAAPSEGGWTALANGSGMWVGYKIMSASPDTTATFWDSGGAGDSGVAVALAFSGVNTSDPIDASMTSALSTNDPAAITPDNDGAAIIVLSSQHAFESSPGTITNYTSGPGSTASDTTSTAVWTAYRILTGGGGASENPGAWNSWTGSGDFVNYTVALRRS